MLRNILLLLVAASLAACSSLGGESAKLEVGASRSDVSRVMGPAPYEDTYENVDSRKYSVVAGFGVCDYREFYIYRDVQIFKNEYHNASVAGCALGRKSTDWEPVLNAAKEYDAKHLAPAVKPVAAAKSGSKSIVEQLQELNKMKESGALTEQEYAKGKKGLLGE